MMPSPSANYHLVRLDSRVGKDGTGMELVFDVTDWKNEFPEAHAIWVDTYSSLQTTGPSRTGSELKITLEDITRASGKEVCTIKIQFATGPTVGNPTDVECQAFETSKASDDVYAAIATVNEFLATATNDLPTTTIDAINDLFVSGSEMISQSVRTNCFWIDSFMSSAPTTPSTPPTPPSTSTTKRD